MLLKQAVFSICFCLSLMVVAQQDRVEGKAIKGFGETFKIDNPEIATDTGLTHKVIFDVSKSSEDKSTINKYIETAARFLNMHMDAGMKSDQLHVAMTIHGGAWQDILTNEAYKELYGVPNPNAPLIKALTEAGAEIILCGQTKAFRGVEAKDKLPEVKVALSAMTALLQFQNNGYKFIKF
ncbi:MAG: DsrE family protein [Flavobacteriaceae bacterium]|nr:DsrE family protein [Flavobacteriaceae bacterium]